MNQRRLRVMLLTASVILMLASMPLAFDFSELEKAVSEYELDNGLKILIMERHDAPVVSFVTWVDVGGVNDPKEYTGLAHMFEHMAFKGTREIGTTDINAELEAMRVEDSIWYELREERKKGIRADSTRLAELENAFADAVEAAGQYVVTNDFQLKLQAHGVQGLNAGTSKDQTMYMMSLPSNKVELWMATESERFLNPVLREMYRERDVIAEERRQTLENNPIMRTIWSLMGIAYKAHPYGVTIDGHMSDIQNYTRDAAKAYFDKYYVPSNMVVAIVGDVNPKNVFKLAQKYWGRLTARPKPEAFATVEPEQKGERRLELEDRAQPFFVAGWHVCEDTHPDWPALEALTDYLGKGRTSLLYTNLVKEKKIAATSVALIGWPASKYPSMLVAFAIPSPNHTNEECEEQIFTEVEKIRQEVIPVEEVEKIKARAKAAFVNSLGSNMGLAMQLCGYQTGYGDWRELFRQLDKINAVTPEDIQRVAQKYLTKKNRSVAKLNTVEG
ncbi:MAG: insulinase family protein [Candidatus Zixiibacteriota bacterium]|nr:MAG: insulinase family protein [candidate division Zixibacteria bacterium]